MGKKKRSRMKESQKFKKIKSKDGREEKKKKFWYGGSIGKWLGFLFSGRESNSNTGLLLHQSISYMSDFLFILYRFSPWFKLKTRLLQIQFLFLLFFFLEKLPQRRKLNKMTKHCLALYRINSITVIVSIAETDFPSFLPKDYILKEYIADAKQDEVSKTFFLSYTLPRSHRTLFRRRPSLGRALINTASSPHSILNNISISKRIPTFLLQHPFPDRNFIRNVTFFTQMSFYHCLISRENRQSIYWVMLIYHLC